MFSCSFIDGAKAWLSAEYFKSLRTTGVQVVSAYRLPFLLLGQLHQSIYICPQI